MTNDQQIDKVTIFAKSSSSDAVYSVDFIFKNNRNHMAIHCNCPAGRFGKFCKHKMSFIQGDYRYLYDDDQYDQLVYIADWVQKSQYLDLIFKRSPLKQALREAEYKLEEIKEKIRPINNEIAKAMKKGLDLYE